MKSWLGLAVLLAACSSDTVADGPKGDGGTGADAAAGTPDALPGAAPVITKIAWMPGAPCTTGTMGPFTFTVTATDADTATGSLTINVSLPHCNPTSLMISPGTASCPNEAPYSDNKVTVSDPEGHSASLMFTISPCQAGMAP